MNRSYRSYILVFAVYNLLMAIVLFLGHRRGIPMPRQTSTLDIALTALATFRLSGLISHDTVTRFLREPFIEVERVPGPGGVKTEQEVPEAAGIRRALGELVTCTQCSAVWVAAGLSYLQWLMPSLARPFIYVLAIAGVSEIVDAGNQWLKQSSQWYYRHYTKNMPIPNQETEPQKTWAA